MKDLQYRIEIREKALELFDSGATYETFQEEGLQNSWFYTIKNDREAFEAALDRLKGKRKSQETQTEETIAYIESRKRVLGGEIKRYHRVIQKANEEDKDIYIARVNELIKEREELD